MVFQIVIFFALVAMSKKLQAAEFVLSADDGAPYGDLLEAPTNVDDGVGLRQYLLQGYKSGKFTAKDVCSISFHAGNGGCEGLADLAMDPKSPGENFARHLRTALGVRAADTFYCADIPMWDHVNQRRILAPFPFYLPTDVFSDAYAADPTIFDLSEMQEELPPDWAENEICIEHGAKAIPISFYTDGVPFTKSDSFVSFYMQFVGRPKRYLLCAIRKSDFCKCGCRGTETLSAILRVLSWSFNVVSSGLHSAFDHNGAPFQSEKRHNLRGFTIANGYCGALTEYRADILEIVDMLGFRRWSDVDNPCFQCGVCRDELFDFPMNMCECNWPVRDKEAYQIMCDRSLKIVSIRNKTQLKALMRVMDHDWTMAGYGLQADFAPLGLQKGMRLMEAGVVKDVHTICDIQEFPCDFTFFDNRAGMGINFICPLFSVRGFGISSLHLDTMHIIDLGVLQYLIGVVFKTLIDKNFAKSSKRLKSGRQVDNMNALRRLGVARLSCACADKESGSCVRRT